MINLKVDAVKLGVNFGDGVSREVMGLVKSRVISAMNYIHIAILTRLSQPGSGEMYGSHQASAPGEPPAPDSGDLAESFEVLPGVSLQGTILTGTIESDLWGVYGRRLELGGYGGGAYIAPRPYIRPVLEETEEHVQDILDGKED